MTTTRRKNLIINNNYYLLWQKWITKHCRVLTPIIALVVGCEAVNLKKKKKKLIVTTLWWT